jgi:hypothetical protein
MSDHSHGPRDHSESGVDDLLGAFALDAVDPQERALVERHLAVDPVARAEVDEMRETASLLASAPSDASEAPADLWGRIAAAIAPGAEADVDDVGLGERRAVTPIPITRAKRRRSIPMRVFAPIVAAAAIVLVVLAVQVANRPPSRAGDLVAAYHHAVAHGATTLALDSGPGGSTAAEIALQSDGTGYLRNEHLAALPAGRTYQLWAVVGTGSARRTISAGVLGADPNAVAFHVAGRPEAFAITVEDAPGVVQSSQPPTALGTVPA